MGKTAWLIPTLVLSICGWAQQTTAPGQQSAAATASSSTGPPGKIMMSSGVAQGNRIDGEAPKYPAIAKAAGVQGTVVLRVTISEGGTVEDQKVISGPPMLEAAAMDAVRTWRYKPYLLNGKPIKVETLVNIVFSLGEAPAANAAESALTPGQMTQGIPGTRTVQITGVAPPADQPAPEHPVTAEQVREIMRLTGASQLSRQMLESLMPEIQQNMPPWMPADVLRDFENSMLGGNLEDLTTRAYQAHISTEDATALIGFYETPAAQRFVAASPAILKQVQTEASQLALQIFQEAMKRHQTEIDAAKQKYEVDHPWSAPKH